MITKLQSNRVATFLKRVASSACHVLFVAVLLYLSVFPLWCWELDVDLFVSVPEFTYLLYVDLSRKRAYIILTPSTPLLYSKTGVYRGIHVFLILLKNNIECGYSLEPPRRGGSNEYPQSMFWAGIWKISKFFIWKVSFFGFKIFNIFE